MKRTQTAWLLSAALLAPSLARAVKPVAEQWKGFTLSLSAGVAGQDALQTVVYFNSQIHGPKGTVDILPAGTPNAPANVQKFSYDNSFPLFDLKRLPVDPAHPDVAVFEKTKMQITLYVDATPNKTRFVVRADGDKVLVLADKPTRDALGIKTLAELETTAKRPIPDPAKVVVRDPGAAPTTPTADKLTTAINSIFTDDKTEAALVYAVVNDADHAPDAVRAKVQGWRDAFLADSGPKPTVDAIRNDTYYKKRVGDYAVTGNDAAIASVLHDRGISNDDVLASFCPKMGHQIGSVDGAMAFQQARAADVAGHIAASSAKPEDVAGDADWSKSFPSVQAKCNEFNNRGKTSKGGNGKVANQTGQGSVDPNAAGSGGTLNNNGSGNLVFQRTAIDSDPPPDEKKKTNPLKNQIAAAKVAVWAGLLGFIFGGVPGLVILGAAGFGLGYWMSSYK